jgi:hypothetical protein
MAFDWQVYGVHVVVVEGTYIPNQVTFQIDANIPSSPPCAAKSWLVTPGQGSDAPSKQANVEAIYTLLLAAKLNAATIDLFGSNGNVGAFCATAIYIHLD